MKPLRVLIWLIMTAGAAKAADATPVLEFSKDDTIAVIGNTLADRMQHDAWLDAYLHCRFPESNLSVRHMGFSGDEIGGFTANPNPNKRMRSAAFGSNDDWLRRVKANEVFAFFGYNESFAGPAGVEAFQKELDALVKHLDGTKFNGGTTPTVVLFTPVAFENHKSPNLPSGDAINANLKLYSKVIRDVGAANKVQVVDLFTPSAAAYAAAKKPLTINGIHLTGDGYKALAPAIDKSLFGTEFTPDAKKFEATSLAAMDRNATWFLRYRATDGYSVFGGRADLRFVGGQTNRIVAQRELEVLDVMTANRDAKVNAAAQGKDYTVDDKNPPDFIPVVTNKPGLLEGGKHKYFTGAEAIEKMTVGKNLKVTLFADEKRWPELANPVQMAWDRQGRLWVAVWPTYPHVKPKEPQNDKLLVFEDTDGDGVADKMTVFADNLHNPTGFEFTPDGVLVAQVPDLLLLKDTDGDGKADVRERVLHGLDSADTHHSANSFATDPSGAVYFQEGTFHHSQFETPYGPPERVANGAVFRYEPRTQKANVYVSFGFANPHGHVFDKWGQDIVVDGTGSNPYHAPLFSGHLDFPAKHGRPPQVYQQRTRPCGGMEYLTSQHFPEEFQGNLIVTNVIGFQGLLRYKIEATGSSLKGTELEPILSSTDPNFRPVDVKTGPDGALYFVDWQNPIIGHMQHNLRDPSRDKEHGRIYRVSYIGRESLKPAKIDGEPIAKLLELLKSPEDRVRKNAKLELGTRKSADVIAEVQAWAANLDKDDKDYAHHLTEALWVHQGHNVVNADLLNDVLASKDENARAAAVRVLTHWRERVPASLDILKKMAADDSARVRLIAVWGASFFAVPEAIEVVLVAGEKPRDPFLDHLIGETRKALDPVVAKAIAAGKVIRFTTAAGARYFLKSIPNDDLLKVKRSAAVYTEFLNRKGIREEFRREAATELAKSESKTEAEILLDAIIRQDTFAQDESVAFDLVRILTDRKADLPALRADFERLATSSNTALIRQLGYVSLIAADDSPEKAWATAIQSVNGLRDFVTAVPMIRDPLQRAALYPKLLPLLEGLPKDLANTLPKNNAVMGRYIRIELPGKQRTLTLAELEVFSDGKNVARNGTASQSSTSNGGVATRAIDGNKSGGYNDGGQTHSVEGSDNPWWEVDLGKDYPIDSIGIFNRTDGNLGTRLKDYTLLVRDAGKNIVFQLRKQPTPVESVKHIVSGEAPERIVRRSAMLAITSIRGKETETFQALAKFVAIDAERPAAVQALQRIPASGWPKDQAAPLLATLSAYVAKVPEADRTKPEVLDALQLGDSLAGLLPKAQAKTARKALGELGVRVLRVGTVTDQMIFDKDRIVVQAGKPVEFVFENTDIMPHNFVIVQPGALAKVGEEGEVFGTQPGAQEKNFVPPSKEILLGSKLLQPQNNQNLRFQAPAKAGVYPYVCTYPGHWRRMHGALYVVEDLDEYLADPEAYVAKEKIAPVDELLKFNRPRTEWKLADIAPSVDELDKGGRSFARGKQIFNVAACVSCHKFDNAGQDFGPDLTKLDAKEFKTPADVLKHVLEPSLRIEEKYRSFKFDLLTGGSFTGMVLEKTPGGDYKVIENPLAKAERKLIKKDDIDGAPKPSPVSIMPKGLLDKLTKDEILDVLAYVWSKADPKHKYFAGGEHKHGH